MLRVIREIKPQWVVAENVPGLLSIDAGLVFETVLSDLEALGYETLPLVYPAAGVGAPHKRDRVFIVAHREDLGYVQPGIDGRDEKGPDAAKRGDVENTGGAGTWNQRGETPDERRESAETGGTFIRQAYGETGANRTRTAGQDVADAEERGRAEGNKDAGGRGAGTGEAEERAGLADGSGREAKRGLGGMADEFPGWLDEPAGIPRVSTGDKNRVNRLKALGNAVVPAQAYPIFRAIAEAERRNENDDRP